MRDNTLRDSADSAGYPVIGSGSEDIGANVFRTKPVPVVEHMPVELESRALEAKHRAAEDAARAHRLKLDRVIHSALVHFYSSGYGTAYVNGVGDFGCVSSDEEVKSLIHEAINELSPVIRDGHTREEV